MYQHHPLELDRNELHKSNNAPHQMSIFSLLKAKALSYSPYFEETGLFNEKLDHQI